MKRAVLMILVILLALVATSPASGQEPAAEPPSVGIRGDGHGGVSSEAAPASGSPALSIVGNAMVIPSAMIHDPQGFQDEAMVAVSPQDANLIAVAYNNARRRGANHPRDLDATVGISRDGGQTWQEVIIPGFPAQGNDETQGNTTPAFMPSGRLVLATLSFPQNGGAFGGVYVVTSDDGGTTWNPPIQLDQEGEALMYYPHVATSPANQRVVVCWSRWYSNSSMPSYCSYSNYGADWSAPTVLPGNTKPQNLAVRPYFGNDGTLYAALFSNDGNTTDVVFYREGGNRRVVATQPGQQHYLVGGMPSMVENGSGFLYLTWGDGTNIWLSTSIDSAGNAWTAPQLLAGGTGGGRFMKPFNCVDPRGEIIVGSYYYSGGNLQLYIGKMYGGELFPVGPKVAVTCDINDIDCHWQYMGSRNSCASNRNAGRPGVVAAFTTVLQQRSEPPGYINGLNNNAEGARITVAPWVGNTSASVLWPSQPPTGAIAVTAQIPLFNEGLETGSFRIDSWSGGGAGCPVLGGIPTGSVQVRGRRGATAPITVPFPELPENRECIYQLTVVGGYGGQTGTNTLTVNLAPGQRIFLPVVFKNH